MIDKSKQGDRILKLSLTDYASVNQKVQFYPSIDPLVINVDLKKLDGSYKIESSPLGAEVFINGEYKGHTPLQGVLPVGSYQVELKMEEYASSFNNQLRVNKQSVAALNVQLKTKDQTLISADNELIINEQVSDASGNLYNYVKIGEQVWLAENLKTERYSNGDLIPNEQGNSDWAILNRGSWCNYNSSNQNIEIYGKLYNWFAVVDSRNVCPVGWHVPSDSEWKILSDYLGGDKVSGGKLKFKGRDYWKEANLDATDSFGFKGLPAGGRGHIGTFDDIGYGAYWWSSTKSDSYKAWCRNLGFNNSSANRINVNKQNGFSVRCLKD